MRDGRKTSRCSNCRSRYWNSERTGKWLPRGATTEQRFWAKVNRTTGDLCWEWTGAICGNGGDKGYGLFLASSNPKRMMVAHRFSYMLAYGEVPKEILILHKCDNRRCVKPKHLFKGNNAINSADMKRKNRSGFGERNTQHKLTEEQVIRIREIYHPKTNSTYKLAKEYGVSRNAISRVINGLTWHHLTKGVPVRNSLL